MEQPFLPTTHTKAGGRGAEFLLSATLS
jgi:hypothetical protein